MNKYFGELSKESIAYDNTLLYNVM